MLYKYCIKYFLQIILNKTKMIWCHICQSETQMSVYSPVCNKCGSQAIEQIQQGQSHPSNFTPFVIGQRTENSISSQQSQITEADGSEDIPVTIELQTIVVEDLQNPGQLSVIRYVIVHRNGQQPEKKVVNEETFQKLKKVETVSECAICQESGGDSGVKLNCSHNFHEKCIKPWFEQHNTCPCCRTEVL